MENKNDNLRSPVNLAGVINLLNAIQENIDSIADPDIKDILFYSGCMYTEINTVPNLYPITPGGGPTNVTGHANPNEWGTWTNILPSSVIDASEGVYFDVVSINIENITANSAFYFEMRYNNNTVARGYVTTTGTGVKVRRDFDFKFSNTTKVENEDLEMRIMSDQAGETVSVDPIMWCSGDNPQ